MRLLHAVPDRQRGRCRPLPRRSEGTRQARPTEPPRPSAAIPRVARGPLGRARRHGCGRRTPSRCGETWRDLRPARRLARPARAAPARRNRLSVRGSSACRSDTRAARHGPPRGRRPCARIHSAPPGASERARTAGSVRTRRRAPARARTRTRLARRSTMSGRARTSSLRTSSCSPRVTSSSSRSPIAATAPAQNTLPITEASCSSAFRPAAACPAARRSAPARSPGRGCRVAQRAPSPSETCGSNSIRTNSSAYSGLPPARSMSAAASRRAARPLQQRREQRAGVLGAERRRGRSSSSSACRRPSRDAARTARAGPRRG